MFFDVEVEDLTSRNLGELASLVVDALASQMRTNLTVEKQRVSEKLSGEVLEVRSGRLLSSVRTEGPEISGDAIVGATAAGGSESPEGVFQEYGTHGPYEIHARIAKALAFEVDGELIFRRSVTHPGLEPRPFMSSSQEELAAYEMQEYVEAVNRALNA